MLKKVWLISFCLFFLFASLAFAFNTLNDNVSHVWALGNNSDLIGSFTLNSTSVNVVPFKNGNAYNFTSTSSSARSNNIIYDSSFSVSCWTKTHSTSGGSDSYNAVFSTMFNNPAYGIGMGFMSNLSFFSRLGNSLNLITTQTFSVATEYLLVTTYNKSNLSFFVNSNLVKSGIYSNYNTSSNYISIGRLYYATNAYTVFGAIDECYYWNRTLSQTEINLLYNSGFGCFYPFYNCTFFFVGNITSPANNTRSNQPLNATFFVSRLNETDFNCSIYINNKLNKTNTSVQANTLTNFLIEDMTTEGSYDWVLGCQNENFTQNASTFTYYYDPSEPVFSIQTPAYTNTTVFDQNILIDGNITDNSLFRVNMTITAPNASILYNNYSGDLPANTTFYNLTQTISSWQLPEGTYLFYLEAADSHTSKYFNEAVVSEEKQKDKEYDLKLSKDTVNFKLGKDMGIKFVKDFDRIKFELDAKGKLEKKQLKIQPTEKMVKIENSAYKCHYVFGDYWFDCEGLENPAESFDKATNTLTIDFDMNTDKVTTDSLGGLNENEISLSFEINHTCFPDWQTTYGSCELNDSRLKYYVDSNTCGIPLNLPADNNTWLSCNYCDSDIQLSYTSACYHNSSDNVDLRNYTYIDNNYAVCCAMTGLYSDCAILYEPYNTTLTERCYLTTGDFNVQYDEHADFGLTNDKVYWSINLNDSNNDYKCTSYVITEEGRLIQTNPVYTKQSDTLIKFRDTNYEDREFFNIQSGIGNVYFSKENLLFDGRDYVFGVQCAGNNQTLKTEKWVVVGYENINAPTTRAIWAQGQISPLILIIIGLIIVFITLAILIKIWKGR